MFLRDPLPPNRVDVRILFDRELRRRGIETNFVGTRSDDAAVRGTERAFVGRLIAFERERWPSALAWLGALLHDLRVAWRSRNDYEIFFVRDRPIEAVPLFVLARCCGIRCAYWMSFPIPLGDRTSGLAQMRTGRRLRGGLVWLRGAAGAWIERRFALPLADMIFLQSDEMKRVVTESGIRSKKCTSVPMGVDRELVEVLEGKSAVPLPPGGNWIAYLGTLERSRRLDVLIEATALLRTTVPDARLALIGGASSADVQLLMDQVRRFDIESAVIFYPSRPMDEALLLARSAVVGVSPIPPGPLYNVSSPTKAIEYLAMGIPAVVSPIPDQRALIEASGGGLCAEFSAEAIARALAELLSHPCAARQMGAKGKRYVLAHRSYEALGTLVEASLHESI